jgi:hypothetical protein
MCVESYYSNAHCFDRVRAYSKDDKAVDVRTELATKEVVAYVPPINGWRDIKACFNSRTAT